MKNYLLGIDYGTGGAKACIIDDKANVIAYSYREYPIYTPNPGWSEHDPNLYWPIACDMIQECLAEAGINPKDIKGIANSSALPSMVMVDEDHNPINFAYNLMDRRASEEVRWIEENIGGRKIFEVSCNRLEDHPFFVNLMWEKANRPDDYYSIYKAVTIDGYIRLKLTGEATANYSSGSFFGVAYDIRTDIIDQDILDAIGISKEILPDFFPCDHIVGYVTEQAAKETGLVPGIPVAAGSVDCNAGWISGGAIEVGDMQVNLGTSGVMGVIHRDPNLMVDSLLNSSYTTGPDDYVTITATTTGGQALRYIRDNLSQLELATENLVPGFNSYQALDAEAEPINIGADGLIFLPYLMGERTPLWDPKARGVLFGLSLNHTKGHIVRATLEGVAFALYESFEILKQQCSKINYPIVMNEGGAKSKIWRRIITDVFNAPTILLKSRTGAPLGDAILAGVATGVFPSFQIAKDTAEYIDRMEPDQKAHDRYMQYYELYKQVYENVKDSFADLEVIRDQQISL